jgi:hypothetical protein
MSKEPYIKPEIKSEVLEPGALATGQTLPPVVSGGIWGRYFGALEPLFGLCCSGGGGGG